jgi:hypothetical protein
MDKLNSFVTSGMGLLVEADLAPLGILLVLLKPTVPAASSLIVLTGDCASLGSKSAKNNNSSKRV